MKAEHLWKARIVGGALIVVAVGGVVQKEARTGRFYKQLFENILKYLNSNLNLYLDSS